METARTLIPHTRLINQHIAHPPFDHPAEAVRWMGALQAQDYAQALWAVGLRTRGAGMEHVEQAILNRQIVRTWPLRGTLHFVAAGDARWMTLLTAPRRQAHMIHRQKQLELDPPTLSRSMDILAARLSGGKCLTRTALMEALEGQGISTSGQRGYHILLNAAIQTLICMGPQEGKQQTFVLLDEWVQHSQRPERDEALANLALRYFASHGPAPLSDLARWAGISPQDARTARAAIHTELDSLDVDGENWWFVPGQVAPDDLPADHLLPGFDEYLIGYGGRELIMDVRFFERIVPGGNGVFKPMLVLDGQIVGVWARSFKKNTAHITLQPFQPLPGLLNRLSAAVQHYCAFWGLAFATVEVEQPGS